MSKGRSNPIITGIDPIVIRCATTVKPIWLLLAAGLVLLCLSPPAGFAAEPETKVFKKTYAVSGRTGREIKKQMAEKGPSGFWALTRWDIRWSSDCKVSLTITQTYPRLEDRAKVPLSVRNQWDSMLRLLEMHEQGHRHIGQEAAKELIAEHCKNARSIIAKWARQDEIYDFTTDHGAKQGVTLAD